MVLGYLTSLPFVPVPIIGCRLEQFADSMHALDVRLTPGQVRSIADAAQ